MPSAFFTIQEATTLIGNEGGQPCLGRLLDGTMLVVARVNSTTPDTRVYLSVDNGRAWSIDGELNSTFGPGSRQLFVGPDETVSIGCESGQGTTGAHYVHRLGPGSFSSRFRATSTTQLSHACFARDSQGRGHVVVKVVTPNEVRYYRQASAGEDNTGTAWSGVANELVVTSGITNASRPFLLIDKFDIPHVIYFDAVASKYKHTKRSGGSWSTPLDVAPGLTLHAGDYISPCLGIDRVSIHLGIYAGPTTVALTPHYLLWDGASWTAESIDATFLTSTGTVNQMSGMCEDQKDQVFAYFIRDSETAYFSRSVEGAWSKEVIDFGAAANSGQFGTACQHYPLRNGQPIYPLHGGHFAGRFNNGTAQANRFAYLAGADIEFGVGGLVCRGFASKGPQSTSSVLQQLMLAYDIVAQDVDGVLTFKFRSAATDVEIDDGDLGAYESGATEIDDPVREDDSPNDQIPRQVVVRHMDPDRAYQISPQIARNAAYSVDQPLVMEVPLAMLGDEAKALAERALWTQHANRSKLRLRLPPSLMRIFEYDRLAFNAFGGARTAIASRVDRGANLLLEVEALNEVLAVLTQPGLTEDSVGFQDGTIVAPSDMLFDVLDLSPLFSEDEQRLVLYFAAAALNPDALWTGGTVFVSTDNVTYNALRPIATEAVMGFTLTTLGGILHTGMWDRVNTLDVEIVEGTLSSATAAEVLSGANRLIVGQEVIAFRDAQLIATNQYRLSHLLRGLRNTERFNDRHGTGEPVIQVGEGVQADNLALTNFGKTLFFKAVPAGGAVEDYEARRIRVRGGSILPWSVCQEQGARDGSNNLTITWRRRSRALASIFGPAGAPLLDTPEQYEVDVYDPTGATVVRTIETDEPSAEYLAADQSTDGYTPGDPVTIAVYQISATIGRGRAFKAVV